MTRDLLRRLRIPQIGLSQGLSSVTNIALTATVSILIGLDGVAAVAIATGTYAVVIQVSRGLVGEVALSQRPQGPPTPQAPRSASWIVGLVLAAATASIAWASHQLNAGAWTESTLALTVFLPGLVALDNDRLRSFKNDKGRVALKLDTYWLVTYSATMAVPWFRDLTAAQLVLVWSGCGAFTGVWVDRSRPKADWRRGAQWLREQAGRSLKIATEQALRPVARQGLYAAIAVMFGAHSLGLYRLAEAALGPINVFVQGTYLSNLAKGSHRKASPLSRSVLATFGYASIVLLLARFLPGFEELAAEGWLVLGLTLASLGALQQAHTFSHLRSHERDSTTLTLRLGIEAARLLVALLIGVSSDHFHLMVVLLGTFTLGLSVLIHSQISEQRPQN